MTQRTQRTQRAAAAGLLVLAATLALAAVLLGALAAGSPVPDEANVASSTAGIHLGTPAPAPVRAPFAAVEPILSQQVLRLLLLVLASVFTIVLLVPLHGRPTALHRLGCARRGPPSVS